MLFKTTADKRVNLYCTAGFVDLVKLCGLDGLTFSEDLCSVWNNQLHNISA